MFITDVLIEPIQTEKSVHAGDKYFFRVHHDAKKPEIARAVKNFYGVEPEKINVINVCGKMKRGLRGNPIRRSPGYRKAIVTLTKGTNLNFNDFK